MSDSATELNQFSIEEGKISRTPDMAERCDSAANFMQRRPARRVIRRPEGLLLTRVDGSRVFHHDKLGIPDEGDVTRTVSRQSRPREGQSEVSLVSELVEGANEVSETGFHKDGQKQKQSVNCSSESDIEDYDTDLDCDNNVDEIFQGQTTGRDSYDDEENSVDDVCLEDYYEACQTAGAVVQSAIARNLGNADLDLSHRNIGSRQLKPLFNALKENRRVERLLLDDTGLDEDGMVSLADGLRENVTVSYLSLSRNCLGNEGLAHVVRLLLTNKSICGLDLSDTKLSGESIPLLSHLLKENKELRFLNLSHNTFEEDKMRVMAAAIGENRSLHFLSLAWNKIRHTGAAAIGQCLAVNNSLRILELSWNGLGYQGAVALATSLKKNVTLQELDLSQNGINWQGAFILSQALAKNSTLQILRIGGNPMTTTGSMDLVEAASSPLCKLHLLDLWSVPVTFETEVLASSITQSRRNFRLNHGGVVLSHDKLGLRMEREQKPMERLLTHLRERMIRPLELLREFDKEGHGHISKAQFISRLRRANVSLHGFEIRTLAESVSSLQHRGSKEITYKNLVQGIEEHILKERMRKVKARINRQRRQAYHTRILHDSKPHYTPAMRHRTDTCSSRDSQDIVRTDPLCSGRTKPGGRHLPCAQQAKLFTARESTLSLTGSLGKVLQQSTLPQVRNSANTFSMSAPLDQLTRRLLKSNPQKQRPKTSEDLTTEITTLIGEMKMRDSEAF